MRTSTSALALIRGPQSTWLAQWNAKWTAFSLIGGHKHDDESFRACCIREICEELELDTADFHVAEESIDRLEFDAWSESARADTHYVFEVFETTLAASALTSLGANPHNRWLNASEVRAAQTSDGRPISPTVQRVLAALGEMDY